MAVNHGTATVWIFYYGCDEFRFNTRLHRVVSLQNTPCGRDHISSEILQTVYSRNRSNTLKIVYQQRWKLIWFASYH